MAPISGTAIIIVKLNKSQDSVALNFINLKFAQNFINYAASIYFGLMVIIIYILYIFFYINTLSYTSLKIKLL